MIRLPRLLTASFTESRRLRPDSLKLDLKLKGVSQAQMTLGCDETPPDIRDWVEIFTLKGSAGLFRVTGDERVSGDKTSLTLMHAIDTLSDSLWKQQRDYSGTVRGYLTALLAQQNHAYWQLGACQDTAQWKKSGINYDKLSDLLNEVAENETGFYFTYDFSTSPWTLNFLALPQGTGAEFRLTRNLQRGRISRSDGDMCNKLYLSINTKTTDSNDIETTDTEIRVYDHTTSQQLYGVIERCADIDTENVADPDAWAEAFLAQRAFPISQAPVDGVELSHLTGESWDEARLGALTRVNINGETVEERMVSAQYPDLMRTPELVTPELGNRLFRFSESMADLRKQQEETARETRSHGRGGASNKDMEHWAMVAKKTKDAQDATGVTEMYESGIVLDAEEGLKLYSLKEALQREYAELKIQHGSISTLVEKTGINRLGNQETLYSKITQTATEIATLVQKTGVDGLGNQETLYSKITQSAAEIATLVSKTGINRLGNQETLYSKISQTATNISTLVSKTGINSLGNQETLYSKISQTAGNVSTLVSKSGINALGQGETLYSLISQNASDIALRVARNELLTQLTVSLGNVSISGGNLVVDGYVETADLRAVSAEINYILSGTTKASRLFTADLQSTGTITGGTIYATSQLSVGYGSGGGGGTFYFRGNAVSWKSVTVIPSISITLPSITRGNTRNFVYAVNGNTENLSTMLGSLVTDWSSGSVSVGEAKTIYYLGRS